VQGCKNKEIGAAAGHNRTGNQELSAQQFMTRQVVSDRLELALFTMHHRILAAAAAEAGTRSRCVRRRREGDLRLVGASERGTAEPRPFLCAGLFQASRESKGGLDWPLLGIPRFKGETGHLRESSRNRFGAGIGFRVFRVQILRFSGGCKPCSVWSGFEGEFGRDSTRLLCYVDRHWGAPVGQA